MVDIYNQFKNFKAFEVTFFDKDKNLQKIFCTVRSIENDNVILDADNKRNKNIFAEVGSNLKLYIYTENGIYSSESKVLKVDKSIINTEYIISYPINSKHSQRREYFRAEIPVDFEIVVLPEDDKKEKIIINGKTKNICGKGMNYVANTPFPNNKSIDIKLFFKEQIINTLATHVYSKQMEIRDIPIYIHAFAFTTIHQRDIDFIVKKCFLHQLNLRKQKQKNKK